MVGDDLIESGLMTCPTIVVFADGVAPGPAALASIGVPLSCFAADGGARHPAALRWPVDVVVGDLDSIDAPLLARLEAAGTRVQRHPVDKDATDLELALELAVDAARAVQGRVVVLGVTGDRPDHQLANVLLACSPRWRAVRVVMWLEDTPAFVVWPERPLELRGAPGDLVTLLPIGGAAHGVCTEGLAFPLRDEELFPGTSRGVSNLLAAPLATVSLRAGTLLVLQPPLDPSHRNNQETPS